MNNDDREKEIEFLQTDMGLQLIGVFDYVDSIASQKIMNPMYDFLITKKAYIEGQTIAQNILNQILYNYTEYLEHKYGFTVDENKKNSLLNPSEN